MWDNNHRSLTEDFVFVIIAIITCSITFYFLSEWINVRYQEPGKFPVNNDLFAVCFFSFLYIPTGFLLARFLINAAGINYTVPIYIFCSFIVWLIIRSMIAGGMVFKNLRTYAELGSIIISWLASAFLTTTIFRHRVQD